MDKAINIVLDGPPEVGRFVEIELDNGTSIKIGKWVKRVRGFWSLRITADDILKLGDTDGQS